MRAKHRQQTEPTIFAHGRFTSSQVIAPRCTSTNRRKTFLVIDGGCAVKGIKGEERIIEKNDIVLLPAKDFYQLVNVGAGPLVLFGNRSEPLGVCPVRAGQEDSK